MTQITSGIRAVLSSPIVYSSFQRLMGAHSDRINYVQRYLKPAAGMFVLDVGCGPADILNYLPPVHYYGFDISASYIQRARLRFGDKGRFEQKQLTREDLLALPKFDRVIAIGLLHHLDDEVAVDLMQMVRAVLAPGGKFVSLDPCLDVTQNPIARFLVKNDRGRNVRDKDGYELLASKCFSHAHAEVRHKTWIPYTHCAMVCE